MRLNPIVWTAILGVSLFAKDNIRLSPRFQTVYVVQMAHGLDQYITGRLTSSRVLWVVLEPVSADAVLTDSVDQTFWTWLTETYPPLPGTPAGGASRGMSFRSDTPMGGKPRGTIFLVDPRRRVVLWSAYALPKGSSPGDLERTATMITGQLKAAFGRE
jgi:hypothetical protein